MGLAIRKTKDLAKELIPYILLGALITSMYMNYKLMNRPSTKAFIDNMPYSHKYEGSEDGIIRDARPSIKVDGYKTQEI
ncbi:hypothetical protein CHL78_012130 [Romboutsia weinsteinii]|uniref:Uncharacterized protein n=1 Tax=Romboutsia weinsteinii TaxID=2020949 RepID=A0A371J1X3_9FIRM|nr:hypothetical protein [Romboutsia weinsteinii]RDY26812.1 hypothetical protein CHL78_012130 [Romboutsia weinsteinii]